MARSTSRSVSSNVVSGSRISFFTIAPSPISSSSSFSNKIKVKWRTLTKFLLIFILIIYSASKKTTKTPLFICCVDSNLSIASSVTLNLFIKRKIWNIYLGQTSHFQLLPRWILGRTLSYVFRSAFERGTREDSWDIWRTEPIGCREYLKKVESCSEKQLPKNDLYLLHHLGLIAIVIIAARLL